MRSIVTLVLAWNGSAFLRPCLNALRAQEYAGRHAILVFDNGSSDGSAELVAAEYPDVALIRSPQNLGFAGGNNMALRALRDGSAPAPADFTPDLVILLNQDTEVAPGWLAGMAAAFEQFPQAGIIGCTIVGPDGKLQHTGGRLEWPLAEASHRHVGEPVEHAPTAANQVEWVTGAAMGLNMALPPELSCFDEGFAPAYFEDVDLCYRVRAAGWQVIYTPAARLLHHENSSLGAQSASHQRYYHRNRVRFLLRHGPLGAALPVIAAAETSAIKRWSTADSLARKAAYRDALLELPATLAARGHASELPAVSAMLRNLHHVAVAEERARRAENLSTAPPEQPVPTESIAPAAKPAHEPVETMPETTLTKAEPVNDEAADVAAIMQQIRRQIGERRVRDDDRELDVALSQTNEQWNKVYEPLHLPPAASTIGKGWEVLRRRIHAEVRSYLDPMIFRQSEFNGGVVRALNSLARRYRSVVHRNELESLRDEVIMLREEVRRLREVVESA
ncbi:MAG: glycosyltransferase family 2 protein [Oscillochloris sp.]|nr:glycosyltransferase family 2 protein [Oscillochloris sp.]